MYHCNRPFFHNRLMGLGIDGKLLLFGSKVRNSINIICICSIFHRKLFGLAYWLPFSVTLQYKDMIVTWRTRQVQYFIDTVWYLLKFWWIFYAISWEFACQLDLLCWLWFFFFSLLRPGLSMLITQIYELFLLIIWAILSSSFSIYHITFTRNSMSFMNL